MNMAILIGPGNTGKSTTVKAVFVDLLNRCIRTNKMPTVHYLYQTKKEVAAVIVFGTIKIGIATRGDTSKHVQEGLTFFKDHTCGIVLCVSRSKGESLETARDFARRANAELYEIQKEVDVINHEDANSRDVARLLNWLRRGMRVKTKSTN